MATPPVVSTPPYSIGALEGAAVGFLGAFATTYAYTTSVTSSVIAGAGAFAAFLGYHAYQSS